MSQRIQQSEARRDPASISRISKAETFLVAARRPNMDLPIVGTPHPNIDLPIVETLRPNIDLPIALIANIDERGLIREMRNVVSLKKKPTP